MAAVAPAAIPLATAFKTTSDFSFGFNEKDSNVGFCLTKASLSCVFPLATVNLSLVEKGFEKNQKRVLKKTKKADVVRKDLINAASRVIQTLD